jgi:predicted nucleic acid-binding protein
VAGVIVLDVSILIAYLDGNDLHHGAAERLLERVIDDDLSVSPLTLAEVLVGPARAGRVDDAVDARRALEIADVPFPADAAVELARLRATTGLRMPDCCVVGASQESAAPVATFDAALVRAAEGLGLETATA